MGAKEALALAERASTVIVSKGKRIERFDVRKDRPDATTLTSALLGPTGNLRAPALLCGKTLLIGFNESEYARVLVE